MDGSEGLMRERMWDKSSCRSVKYIITNNKNRKFISFRIKSENKSDIQSYIFSCFWLNSNYKSWSGVLEPCLPGRKWSIHQFGTQVKELSYPVGLWPSWPRFRPTSTKIVCILAKLKSKVTMTLVRRMHAGESRFSIALPGYHNRGRRNPILGGLMCFHVL